jgi:hypothetical protein
MRFGFATQAVQRARAGIQHRFQYSVGQRCWQRPGKLGSRRALDGECHRAARDANRSGNRSLGRATLVLEAQDLSYTSHRHSLGWHRLPRPSFPHHEQKAAPSPSGRPTAPPSKGGRLQIGMAEIKSESVAGFIPESVADFLRNQQSIQW